MKSWLVFTICFVLGIIIASIEEDSNKKKADDLNKNKLKDLKERLATIKNKVVPFEESSNKDYSDSLQVFFSKNLYKKRSGNEDFDSKINEFSNMLLEAEEYDNKVIYKGITAVINFYKEYLSIREKSTKFQYENKFEENSISAYPTVGNSKILDIKTTTAHAIQPKEVTSANQTEEVESTFFNRLSENLGAQVVRDNINVTKNIEPPEKRYRFGKKIDWDSLNEKRKITGIEGEELVMILEEDYLKSINRTDLANQIRHISKEEGDGLGYDILSYFDDGRKKYIEVKSTKSSIETPFNISQNELSFLEDHYDDAFIYRVLLDGEESKVNVRPAYEILESDITPIVFRVK